MGEAILTEIATKTLDFCVGAAREHLGYIWNYKKNVADLETEVKKLDAERDDMRYSVGAAQMNTEKIRTQVRRWQEKADKVSEEGRQIIKDYEDKGNKRCFMGLCPNLCSRYKLSTKACNKKIEMGTTMTEAREITILSDPATGLGRAIALSTEGLFIFESRNLILEDIMKTLQDETKNPIGLHGLGGMGKTTLAKQVAARAAKDKIFEDIVFAPVTQVVELKKIQEKIASMLDLKLKDSTEAESAGLIYERLKGKKVLVVLDDLWVKLDLKDVGIPFGPKHSGCKIVLTSRYLHVLASMETEKEFVLGALTEVEAWKLFEEKTGSSILKRSDFHTIGKRVAKRCQGLPVLIVTIAASLSKCQELSAWKDALRQLKQMDNKEMHEIVNSAIKSISYNHLEKTHKRLFLLCGVMGGEAHIEELLQYSLGWDLFDEDMVTIEGARDRLHTLIFGLKESCLLLDGYSRNSIKMHDVVRDVAISIGRRELNMLSFGDDAESNIWPKDNILQRCTAIVFRGCCNLQCLPLQLDCPLLELFILRGFSKDSTLTISETFFEKTGKLKVLKMYGFNFSAFVSSLSALTNLQTLLLDGCDSSEGISRVGKLKKLQTLRFGGYGIEEVPSEIGKLSELRSLDLSGCWRLKVIPAGLIEGLPQLEELHVSRSFKGWEVDECISGNVKTNCSLLELERLPKLCSLEISVSDVKFLRDLNFEKLERYEIVVGDMWQWSSWEWIDELQMTRIICLQLSSASINHLQHGVKELLKRAECICLGKLKCIKNVIPALDRNGFPDLKHLFIDNDHELQYIVYGEHRQDRASLCSLESLRLRGLLKLENICSGPLMKESFSKLATLKVQNCNRLESLLSFSMASGLPCLQEIEVSNCDALEEIVAEKNREGDDFNTDGEFCEKIVFAQLRKLSLNYLPKLKNFFSDGEMLPTQGESQKSLKSSMPFFRKVSFPKLEELELCHVPNLTQLWSNNTLQEMACCKLTRLAIKNCARMKHIVAKEEGDTEIETISFPQLSYLELNDLSSLTTFYSESMESYENATQPLFNEKIQFPRLERLEIDYLKSFSAVWQYQQVQRRVTIEEFASAAKISSSTMPATSQTNLEKEPGEILSFLSLRYLTIRNCWDLKHVLETVIADENYKEATKEIIKATEQVSATSQGDNVNIKERVCKKIEFSQLRTLCLKTLPRLKSFCNGEMLPIQKKSQESLRSNTEYEKNHEKEEESKSSMPFFKKVSFPKLESLELHGIPNVIELWSHELQEMPYCNLTFLMVEDCECMKHFVAKEEGETNIDTISFPQLRSLYLKYLPRLTTFYLESVEEMDLYENVTQPLFNEKIKFPRLETLEIYGLDSISTIWQSQHIYQADSFCKLEEVKFECCASLVKMFSSTTPVTTHTNLRNEAGEILFFQNLRSVTFYVCISLQHVFPASVVSSLNQLELLSMEYCGVVETIIDNECYMDLSEEIIKELAATFMFPKLTTVKLINLPKLEYFYPMEHTAQCPALDELVLTDCGKLTVIDFLRFTETQGGNQLEKVISGSEDLSITSRNLTQILRQYGHFPAHLFQSLKCLTITDFFGESAVFPSNFFSIIHNQVQSFRVYNCSFQEILTCEEVIDHADDYIFLPHLEVLHLDKLPELKYICKNDQYSQLFYNFLDKLEGLMVMECPRLTTLVPPSISFRLLNLLIVKDCGVINLIHPSTARSLKQLKILCIIGCEMIEEIIRGEVGDDTVESAQHNNEIIFSRLEYLILEKLPRLTNFCSSGNYSFNFPLLEKVVVNECPKMKTFSGGITTTPKLNSVYLEQDCDGPSRWHDDLNTTVERIYVDMEANILATALPSTSSNNHSEAEAQILKNLAEELTESRLEGQVCKNAINPRKEPEIDGQMVDICENVKGKEVKVSESQEIPSIHNYTAQEQTSSSNPFEVQAQIHEIVADEVNEPEPGVEIHICEYATSSGKGTEICENGEGKELKVSEEASEHFEKSKEQAVGGSLASQHVVASSPRLSQPANNPSCEVSSSHATEMEAKRLATATTLASTSSRNHVEAKSQIHESSSKELTEPGIESQLCENATNPRKGTEICDQGEGKQLEDSEEALEHFEESKEAPCHLNDCSHNSTHQEQAIALSLASQHVVVSSSTFSLPANNPYDELSPCATAPEVQRLPSKVPTNLKLKKARSPIHGPNWFTNWKRTFIILWFLGLFITGSIWVFLSFSDGESPAARGEAAPILLEHFNLSKNQPHALDSPLSESDQVFQEVQRLPSTVPITSTSSSNHIEAEAQIHVKLTEKVNDEPLTEAQICENREKGFVQVADTYDKELETSTATSNSPRENFRGLSGAKDTVPWLSESFQVLEAQPMSRVSAEQVRFMEEASEWFSGYVEQAREYLEQKELVFELELKIDDMEAQLQVLKEEKKVAEEKMKAASRVAKFG